MKSTNIGTLLIPNVRGEMCFTLELVLGMFGGQESINRNFKNPLGTVSAVLSSVYAEQRHITDLTLQKR